MSDNLLKLISIDPSFVPDKQRQEQAKVLLNHLFKKKSIELKTTNDIEFIDQGSNFESVFCNHCGKEIKMESWQDAMDKAHKNNFKDLFFVTPCCHKKASLNDLQYQSAAGFAKFQIEITDPGNNIETTNLVELQKILGTPIRKIWAHY